MNAQHLPAPPRAAARGAFARSAVAFALTLVGCSFGASVGQAQTALADQPVFTNSGVPGNLALALSVEFPTAVSVAHVDASYDSDKNYLGYFDPNKCYLYNFSTIETDRYFFPAGLASSRLCTGASNSNKWSGNFLNWATMQTIDPFRWALTGGYRVKDSDGLTVIEKAWASGQGGTGNFPNRTLGSIALVADNTPLAWGNLRMRIHGLGNKMRITASGNVDNAPTDYDPASALVAGTTYELSVRVRVCDTNVASAGPLEANCTAYPNGNYKPTGLIQKYATKIRYSAFGYLNDSNKLRDGGVLRAQQKFVGPTLNPPDASPSANPATEWDSDTGIYLQNPDSTDASATAALYGVPISNSGVINYLNKFGQITPGSYKTFDNVSELFYAALRYFRNLGNVAEWSNTGSANTATKTTWADGFPVITSWADPIQYACQKNFILGIGDVNTWTDKNVPGATGTLSEPSKPALVVADSSVDAKVATDKVGSLHGLGASLGSATNGQEIKGSYYIAGLAYDANSKDIRPDNAGVAKTIGKQTVQTYWLDIWEYQSYEVNNQFYLAAKYGGFKVPAVFDPYTRSTDIPLDWWSTSGETVGGQPRPDNYFPGSAPDTMVSGLVRAFSSIAANLRAYTTSFSTALPQVASSGVASYSTRFDSSNWTGELTASQATFDATTGAPTLTPTWDFSTRLAAQLAGTGWNTNRRVATFNTATNTAVPFRLANISATQLTSLDTIYRSGADSADYLNYLRGDTTHEESSSATTSARVYRTRDKLVGDIVGSRPRVLGPPSALFSSAANPGYAAFKTAWATRATMVYVGSNAGMLHAVNGSLTGSDAGTEVFAYVPGPLYQGATGSPIATGLQSRGDPDFTHKYLVDATPAVFDIDLARTSGSSGAPNWRSVLVGGLGKGGKAYYAIDVTDPTAFSTEANVAARVMWEFRDTDLGFTYGEPVAVKTRKYGWVFVFGSGYNNSDGKGYFFIVNPRTGALLEKISTTVGSPSSQAGLAHVQAFVLDRTDSTADAVYAGDLLGNVWRLDVSAASGSYPAPVRLAALTDRDGGAVAFTTRPTLVVQPFTNKRWVTIGSGRLLAASDIASSQAQGFYAVMDGTGAAFAQPAALPAGVSFPVLNSNLQKLTDLTLKVVLGTSQMGWWVDLGSTDGYGWRVVSESSSFFGSVTFAPMLPTGDACSASGKSRLYSIDLGSGQSRLLNADGSRAAYLAPLRMTGVITDLRDISINNPDGNAKGGLIAGDDKGNVEKINTAPLTGPGLRRLNWRELVLAD